MKWKKVVGRIRRQIYWVEKGSKQHQKIHFKIEKGRTKNQKTPFGAEKGSTVASA